MGDWNKSPARKGLSRWLAGLATLLAVGPALADESAIAAADRLVSAIYYEGFPYEEARALDLEQAGYLATLLDEPDRARDHANVMLALGMAGHPGSFEILSAYPPGVSGEVSRSTWRLLRARYQATGHLARFDARAEAWLAARARGVAPEAAFSFRALSGDRMRRERRIQALRSLPLAASDSARDALGELATDPDPSVAAAAREARGRIDRIRAVGAEIYFRDLGRDPRPGRAQP